MKGISFVLWSCSALAAAVVLLIGAFVAREAWPALESVGLARFFADDGWYPTAGAFGLGPMVAGSLLVMAGSVLLAAPLGTGVALFCHYFATRPLGTLVRRAVELLGGIPSVVFGFWGLVTLVPLIARHEPPGASLLAGILVLAGMLVPTVALAADAAFAAVPQETIRQARALGLSTWGVVRAAALPGARGALVSGVILQAGRAAGETMAVLMVCGNIVQVPGSLFEPVRTLTANIALEMAYAGDAHRSALFVSGLLLLFFVTVIVVGARAWQ